MEKSLAQAKMRSTPPVPFQHMAMGTIPVTDPVFLKWKETQEKGLSMVTAMARYMPHINAHRRETFEEELAEHQAFLEFNRALFSILRSFPRASLPSRSVLINQSIPNTRASLLPFPQNIPNPRASLPHLSLSIPFRWATHLPPL
jgi:hypothetical protein